MVIQIGVQALLTTIYVVGPPLGAAMAVGLFVAVLQAATQIQETSLSFVPKLIAAAVMVIFTGRWSISHLVDFMTTIVSQMEKVGH